MKPSLLLHACCAPCSSAIIAHLSNYFDITLFFYNPCITDRDEYLKRFNELAKFVANFNYHTSSRVKLIAGEYNPEAFYEYARELADEPERGRRCVACYAQRLKETAKMADFYGFSIFTTTLSISPYKDAKMLNKIGMSIASQYKDLKYLCSDYSYLYPASLTMCEQYRLYQQDYCGCEYSKKYSSEIPK